MLKPKTTQKCAETSGSTLIVTLHQNLLLIFKYVYYPDASWKEVEEYHEKCNKKIAAKANYVHRVILESTETAAPSPQGLAEHQAPGP